MRGINGERREYGEDLLAEMRPQPFTLTLGQLIAVEHADARFAQLLFETDPDLLLIGHQLAGDLVDPLYLLRWRQSVRACGHHAGVDHAFQARDADHVELIEVRGGDREKAQALKQRMAAVLGLA